MVLDSEGEGEWRPTPRGGASGPWHGGWWLAVYGRNLGKKASDLHDVRPTRLLLLQVVRHPLAERSALCR